MLKKLLTLMMLVTGLSGLATAQYREYDYQGLNYRKYRITLVPGISSNGVDAPQYTAKYSLNVIAGYHGGLDGFELGPINITKKYARGAQIGALNITGGDMQGLHIGGVLNYAKSDVHGLQFGGIGNISGGDMQGMQFAGITNIAKGDLQGIQLAGIGNFAGGTMQGVQLAGIANVSNYEMQGLQFSGIANITNGTMQGMQFTGIANISNGTSQGLIGAGIANIANGSSQGLYYAGILNYSEDFQGIAMSGIVNYAEATQGIQLAGLMNIAQDFQGIQVAGLLNYADHAQGIQIGLLNLADHFEGVPIGLISWYNNGRHQLDIWGSDGGMLYAGLKTGTREVYNMLSIGYNPTITTRDVWALAWSIGLHLDLDEAWDNPRYKGYYLNRDITIQHIQEGKYNEKSINHIYSYRYLLGKDLRNGLSFYAGPSLNMMISKDPRNNDYTWYTIHDINRKGRDYKFWIGLSAGFQLN
jgi:hypothetical protein